MTFADAAIAYQLQQSGCSLKFLAPFFGVHRTWLGKTLKSCIEHGADSPLLDLSVGGSKPRYSQDAIKRVAMMRAECIPHKVIARNLRADPEKLLRAYNYNDRRTVSK